MKYLLKIWRVLPLRIQIILSRVIRPLFQVFAAGVIFNQENKILLVKSTYQRFHPWGLPGGSLEYGESPEDAVKREVSEAAHFSLDELPDVCAVDVDMINQLYKMVEFQNYALGNVAA